MEMQQIRYFLALSRSLNFTRAAEECHVSQSALTRAIQALEAELGGDLVRREHGKSHLTELGKRMLPLLERCFESAVTAKSLARSISQDEVSPLSVVVSHSVNLELVIPAIAEVFRALPGLQVKLTRGGGGDVLELLKQGEAEIAIAGPLGEAWERLDHWPLFDETFELVTHAEHELAAHNDLTLDKLKPYALICLAGCESGEAFLRLLDARSVHPTHMHHAITQQDVAALVAQGIGAAVVPASTPQAEGLRRMTISDLPLTRTVSAYAVAGRKRETAAAALLNLLRSSDFAVRV